MEPEKTVNKKKIKNKNWGATFQPEEQQKVSVTGVHPMIIKESRYKNVSELALKYSFNIQAVVGSGFASTVYLGTKNQTKEMVCIKTIDLMGLGFSHHHIELIHKEIEFLKQFHSDYIVQLYDVYESGTFYYLVMELCPGGDLFKMLKMSPSPFPTHFINSIIRQIAHGLLQIHGKGIIHRDLKTENIFISKFPQNQKEEIKIKIGDLGFCISVQEVQKLKGEGKAPQNVGSPIYMSPQTCQCQEYSFNSDIYALGIIWYELYHKKAPWEALSEAELLQKKLTTEAQIWRQDIEQKTKSFITQCISNDCSKRPKCQQILNFLSSPSQIQQKN